MPTRIVTLTGRVSDSLGNTAGKTSQITITTPDTVLGWSAPGGTATSITDLKNRYGDPKVFRLYSTPGSGLKSWTGAVMNAIPRTSVIMYSFKDWPVDVYSWMSQRPTNWKTPVYLTLDHEPEQGTGQGDPTPAEYRQEWAELLSQVKNHPRRGEYLLTPIFTEYYAKRNASTFWNDFGVVMSWPGVDAVGFDIYDSGSNTYRTSEERNAIPLSYARRADVRKPLIIPEWGIDRKVSIDPSGALAAQAMRDNFAYLRKQHDVPYVTWWYEDTWHLHSAMTDEGTTYVRDAERQAFIDIMRLNP